MGCSVSKSDRLRDINLNCTLSVSDLTVVSRHVLKKINDVLSNRSHGGLIVWNGDYDQHFSRHRSASIGASRGQRELLGIDAWILLWQGLVPSNEIGGPSTPSLGFGGQRTVKSHLAHASSLNLTWTVTLPDLVPLLAITTSRFGSAATTRACFVPTFTTFSARLAGKPLPKMITREPA